MNRRGGWHSLGAALQRLMLLSVSFLASQCVFANMETLTHKDEAILRIGVTAFALPDKQGEVLDATLDAMRSVLGEKGFVVTLYSVKDLERAVLRHEVDIVLGSAGLVRRLVTVGLRPLVTSVAPGMMDPNHNEGSAFIVRADKTDYKEIGDLHDKRLVANLEWGFSGYQIALGEVAVAGFNPDHFFASQHFIGNSDAMQAIVDEVIAGRADVGILRLCAFEELRETSPGLLSQVRVLAPREDHRTACVHSTTLYPAHTIAVMPNVTPEQSRELTLALLMMPPTPQGRAWSVATDFHAVDVLLKHLKIGPYAYLREWNITRFIEMFWPWLMLGAMLTLGLAMHGWRTQVLVKRREEQIEAMMKREIEQENRLAFLQRNGTVGQLSSMFAHELRQPLAAITLYASGLARLAKRGEAAAPKIEEISDLIASQSSRASEIVERVRNYARNRLPPRDYIYIDEVLKAALTQFQMVARPKVNVSVRAVSHSCVWANALEMELVLVNLLKNAREACLNESSPLIEVCIEETGALVCVEVSDNGPRLDDKAIAKLTEPTTSAKPQGLGLGLGIVRTIVEAHGGHLHFSRKGSKDFPSNGLTAQVTIPLAKIVETEEKI